MESLTEVVKKEHERLNNMMGEIIESSKKEQNLKELFNKFKWNLEKHFSLEEKGIFESFQMIKGEEVPMAFDLINEHAEIRAIIKQIESKLENSESVLEDLYSVKKEVLLHEHTEDADFYPMLEGTLNENQIKDIIIKCREIIAG